jgi:hypothetical protein
MKPGLLQPTLVRVSDDAAMTIRELAHAVKVVHRVYGPWPSLRAEEVPAAIRMTRVANTVLKAPRTAVSGSGVVDVVAGVHEQAGDAALDTTVYALGSYVQFLAEAPQRWSALKADPGLIGSGFEETLWIETPTQGFYRTTPTTSTSMACWSPRAAAS